MGHVANCRGALAGQIYTAGSFLLERKFREVTMSHPANFIVLLWFLPVVLFIIIPLMVLCGYFFMGLIKPHSQKRVFQEQVGMVKERVAAS